MSLGLCRLCASLRKQEMLTTISDENHDLCQQVSKCFGFHIRMQDKLPKEICRTCVQTLSSFYEFYKKVQESQESLSLLYDVEVERPEKNQQLVNTLTTAGASKSNKTSAKPVSHVTTRASVKVADDLGEVYEIVETIDEDDEVLDDGEAAEATTTGKSVVEEEQLDVIESIVFVEQEGEEEATTVEEDAEEDEEEDENPGNSGANSAITLNPLTKWSAYSWLCYLCSHAAPSRSALQQHSAKCHQIVPAELQYKCNDCQKISTRLHTFLNHVRMRHQPDLALCCDLCDQQCSTFAALARHRAECEVGSTDDQNKQPSIHQCDACLKCFHTAQALGLHRKSLHAKVAQTHKCNVCKKVFKRASALRVHSDVHRDVKRFICYTCGRHFRQKANLDVHMYSHMKERSYECQLCQKSFKTSFNLEKHALVHTDTKEFKCDHCDKEFRTKNAKMSHERTHTGEMPYACTFCSRRFRFRSALKSHVASHTGEKPYSCSQCKSSFTDWSNFNKHMKQRHNTTATELKKKEQMASRSSVASDQKGEPREVEFMDDGSQNDNSDTA